jgi:hypothetical protein
MTNENAGEPTVMVDNQQLRMAQGLDGNWYGYFADSTDVADVADDGSQLEFGTADDPDVGGILGHASLATFDTTTYRSQLALGGTAGANAADFAGVIDNAPELSNWNGTNASSCTSCGQIGINSTNWPFLQTYDFTQEDFDVILEQAGTNEVVTLDHNNGDLDDYSSLTLDRSSATQGAEVMLFIVDQQLNIDPTDEDVVIFKVANDGVASTSSVSWTNGTINGDLVDGDNTSAYVAAGTGHGFSDNGKLLINNDTASSGTNTLEKIATADDTVTATTSGFTYLVFFEDADNTGTFSNVDDNDHANL